MRRATSQEDSYACAAAERDRLPYQLPGMSAAFLSRFSDRISVVGRDGSVVKGEVSGNGTVMASPGQLRSVGGGMSGGARSSANLHPQDCRLMRSCPLSRRGGTPGVVLRAGARRATTFSWRSAVRQHPFPCGSDHW